MTAGGLLCIKLCMVSFTFNYIDEDFNTSIQLYIKKLIHCLKYKPLKCTLH